ncbi:Na-translocating system protein MpsC family protein [Saccharibacillus qingshengii]|uniref:Na-translocating system protein MpsC family protein n=1 Tax=Saccharibacillus qingshengii TaxID=1763540 RepID=UPI001555CD44|nr:Na-translocating system protein MpsC family protein [Saccharibacillus qingshengii]
MLENHKEVPDIEKLVQEMCTFSFNHAPGKIGIYPDEHSLIIHLEDFMGDEILNLIKLQDQDALRSVQELMVEHLLPNLASKIKETNGLDIAHFYYDWFDKDLSGMLIGMGNEPAQSAQPQLYPGQDAVHEKIGQVTYEIEKMPDETYSYWAADHILVIVREGILIKLEKAFLDQGADEILRKVKRNLEKTAIQKEANTPIEKHLNRKIKSYYLDWAFDQNKSFLIYVFEK